MCESRSRGSAPQVTMTRNWPLLRPPADAPEGDSATATVLVLVQLSVAACVAETNSGDETDTDAPGTCQAHHRLHQPGDDGKGLGIGSPVDAQLHDQQLQHVYQGCQLGRRVVRELTFEIPHEAGPGGDAIQQGLLHVPLLPICSTPPETVVVPV